MRVDQLIQIPLAFPSYTGSLAYAIGIAVRQLDLHAEGARLEIGQAMDPLNRQNAFLP